MTENIDIANILFLDIETVSGKPEFESLSEDFQDLWKIKARQLSRTTEEEEEPDYAALYKGRAAIFAEFGKIVCISVGVVYRDKEDQRLKVRLKSFASENEKELLFEFSQMVFKFYNNPNKHGFCGHNAKEFDIPYICRRMVVHQLPLPTPFNISGKKPWETKHLLDTMEMWKFGDRKHYTSLKLLAAVLGFPSPKDDIDGSDVGRVYWEDKDLERLALYCEKDVLATVQLYLRYKYMPLLEEDQVVHVK
ncbi:MAG: 3'-5' exonuclease [Phaeodactylibacter sp.]|nr:3'-5' exonuclease [Phaeodactylibacter sp.]MCB9266791.1 3'-5' exonuclease [Lewinellaceae bacterium]MCB9287681.1 3'-5' exonuclease [Lewinellaceae bacterium]